MESLLQLISFYLNSVAGSYCDTKQSCCYPTTGKPESDFGIHGLWPNYNDGSYPSNCDPDSSFDASAISDLTSSMHSNWPTLACPSGNGLKFWSHEWEKHGTCSESVLDQHGYFETALNLKKKVDLLQILKNAGIQPDGRFYSLNSIKEAIRDATGYTPGIECNVDESGNSQHYQIYICVDKSRSNFIECPVFPNSRVPMDDEEKVVVDYSSDPLIIDVNFRQSILSSIARAGSAIEVLYRSPEDIEGVVKDGKIYVVQTRPQM